MAIKTGLERIAQALRVLSWGWVGIALFITVFFIGSSSWQQLGDLYYAVFMFLGFGVLPAALGHLVAWIIDGFAKKDG